MSRTRDKIGTRGLFIRYSRLHSIFRTLNDYGIDNHGAFLVRAILGTGQTKREILTWGTGNVWPEFSSRSFRIMCAGRPIAVMPEFVNWLQARRDWCERQKIYYMLPPDYNYDWWVRAFFVRIGMGISESMFNRLRITALVKWAVTHGKDKSFLARQTALPARCFDWIYRRKDVRELYLGEERSSDPLPVSKPMISSPTKKGDFNMDNLRYFTDGELCQVYSCITRLENDPEWRRSCILARLALGSGLRSMEIRQLIYADVLLDEDPPVILVRRGKGGKSRHVQVIPEYGPFLRRLVVKHIGSIRPIFPSLVDHGNNVELSRRGLSWLWYRLLNEAGVRRLGIHCARHTFATWEALRLNLFQLQGTLGHSSLLTTSEFYVHPVLGANYSSEPRWRKIALGRFYNMKDYGVQKRDDVSNGLAIRHTMRGQVLQFAPNNKKG